MKEKTVDQFTTNAVKHKISHIFPSDFEVKIITAESNSRTTKSEFQISVKFISNCKTLYAFSDISSVMEEAIVSLLEKVPFEIKIAELFSPADPSNLCKYLEQQFKNRMIFESAEPMDKPLHDYKETTILNIAHNSRTTVEALKRVNSINLHCKRDYDLSS